MPALENWFSTRTISFIASQGRATILSVG